MTNEEIYQEIKRRGLKLQYVAYVLNIDRVTLWRKLKGHSKFTTLELKILNKLLEVSNE